LENGVDIVARASFAQRYGIATHGIFERWRRRDDRRVKRCRTRLVGLVALAGSRAPLFDWQARFLERCIRRGAVVPAIRRQIGSLRPAVVVSTSSMVRDEQLYVLAARDLGVPTLG